MSIYDTHAPIDGKPCDCKRCGDRYRGVPPEKMPGRSVAGDWSDFEPNTDGRS
jgi:hypothetical protein